MAGHYQNEMSDYFGISEGTKTLANSLQSSRDASKNLSKQIEGIQQDGIDVAQQKAHERRRAAREAEIKKQTALIKALEDWNKKKQISDKEAKLKIDFVKKYGAKEWEAVLKIKLDIENLERKANEAFQHDVKEVRKVQFYCFAVAALIAWYLTWGIK
jgi:biotin operon repressor